MTNTPRSILNIKYSKNLNNTNKQFLIFKGFEINFYECGTVLKMCNGFITDVWTVDVSTWPFKLFNT